MGRKYQTIDDLENSVLSLGSLVNNGGPTKRDDSTIPDADELSDSTKTLDTSSLLDERAEKRDNSLYIITREIDDIENTILSLGKLTNNNGKREADNSVTSTAQQATANIQGTAQSSANLINTKRDNILDAITRAIDDLENSTLSLGSLISSNNKRDNTFSSVVQTAIDDIQSTIGALASLTTCD